MLAVELVAPGPAGREAPPSAATRSGGSATGPLRWVERPEPEPGDGEVRIDVDVCAVCRTDLQLVDGDLPARRLPVVPGHQIVGRIAAHGSGVDAAAHPLGARVGVAWIAGACGRCRYCTSGRENLCDEGTFTGWDRDGGYATSVTARADFTYALPEALEDRAVAPLLCGGAIGYRSLRLAGVDPDGHDGGRLGLYGFGASARCVLPLARAAGCEVLVATRAEEDQRQALALGAAWAGPTDGIPTASLDAAITFAPVGSVVVAALAATAKGGTVAINAIHLDGIPAFPYDQLWGERVLRSVANVTRADVTGFLRHAAEAGLQPSVEVFPLDRAGDALDALRAGDVHGAAVLEVGPTARRGRP